MKSLIRLFTYSFLLVFLNSCGQIFEIDADVQARQALLDLVKIQEKFYQENKRYANSHAEVAKYDLKYHSGIVYMEIESAGKDKYRAVALPAESTTARVFAYDSDQGGFYEMEEDEVSRYVLGALRAIRDEKHKKDLNELTGWILMGGMVFLGLRFFVRYRSKENNPGIWAYILCFGFRLGRRPAWQYGYRCGVHSGHRPVNLGWTGRGSGISGNGKHLAEEK